MASLLFSAKSLHAPARNRKLSPSLASSRYRPEEKRDNFSASSLRLAGSRYYFTCQSETLRIRRTLAALCLHVSMQLTRKER
jgi:hypothetical protein